jgi:hypothetical protein
MKYYITTNQNAANLLINYLNTEIINALNTKIYMVEEVDADYAEKKFKVYTEGDVFKGYMRIITSGRITSQYATVIEHKDGGQYAIPISDLTFYDVEQEIIDKALQDGYIHQGELPSDWFETV